MLRSTRSLRLSLTVALLALLPSCGGAGGTAVVPVHQSVPLTQLLHPSTPVVAFVDMDGVRQSPYYAPLRAALEVIPAAERAELERLMTILDRSDQLVWGYDPGSRQEALVNLVAFRGRFEQGDLSRLGPLPETATYRDHTLHGDGTHWAAVANGDTLLIGTSESVHDALDRLEGIFPGSGPTRPGYAETAAEARMGSRDLSVVVLFSEELRAGLGDGDVEHVLRLNALHAAGSAHFRQGIELDAFLTTNDARAVQLLAHELRDALTEAQDDMGLTAVGATGLLRQVQVTEDGDTLRVSLRATDDEAQALVDNLGSLLRTLFGGAQGG